MYKQYYRYFSVGLLVILLFTSLFGWTSARSGLKKIQNDPVLGSGFNFSLDDITREMSALQSQQNLLGSYMSKSEQAQMRRTLSAYKSLLGAIRDYRLGPTELYPLFHSVAIGVGTGVNKGGAQVMNIISIVMLVLYVFFACSILLNIGSILFYRKGFGYLHIIATAIYFVLFIGVGVLVNFTLNAGMGGFARVSLLKPTLWPFLALACSIGSVVLFRMDPARGTRGVGISGIDSRKAGENLEKMFDAGTKKAGMIRERLSNELSSSKGWNCPNCSNTNSENALFCAHCGTARPVERVCTGCGKKLGDRALFCPMCGKKAEEAAPAPKSAAPAPAVTPAAAPSAPAPKSAEGRPLPEKANDQGVPSQGTGGNPEPPVRQGENGDIMKDLDRIFNDLGLDS